MDSITAHIAPTATPIDIGTTEAAKAAQDRKPDAPQLDAIEAELGRVEAKGEWLRKLIAAQLGKAWPATKDGQGYRGKNRTVDAIKAETLRVFAEEEWLKDLQEAQKASATKGLGPASRMCGTSRILLSTDFAEYLAGNRYGSMPLHPTCMA